MTKTSRRAIVAGLAATPLAGLPALAPAAPGADPVHAALARHARARAALNAVYARSHAMSAEPGVTQAMLDEIEDGPFEALCAAEVAALEAKPTTREGALRLLAYVADRLESGDELGNREAELVPDTIRAAVVALTGEART